MLKNKSCNQTVNKSNRISPSIFIAGMLGVMVTSGLPVGHVAYAQDTVEKAQGSVLPASISESFLKVSENGPQALLQHLDEVLKQQPSLAASPALAGQLTRAAAAPIRGFLGANVPVYLGVISRITAAAPETQRPEVTKAVGFAIRRLVGLDPMVIQPLAAGIEETLKEEARRRAQVDTSRGVKLGSFILYPEVQTAAFYDTNIYATRTNQKSDKVAVVAPHVYLVSDWEEHQLTLEAHSDFTRYQSHSSEDSNDYWFSGEGRFDLTKSTRLYGGLLYGNFHEDRDSADDANGLEPTEYTEKRAYASLAHSIDKWHLSLGGTHELIDFDETKTSTTPIDNSGRKRTHSSQGLRVGYDINKSYEVYGELKGEKHNYKTEADANGFDRDSRGAGANIGTNFQFSGVAAGGVYAGYWRQNYDDASLKDTSLVVFGGDVKWRVIPSTLLTAWGDRSVEETTLSGSSGYIYSTSGLSVKYDIADDWFTTAQAYYGDSDFVGSQRNDTDMVASLGLQYDFMDNAYVATDYRASKRTSNSQAAEYHRHQIYLRLGVNY